MIRYYNFLIENDASDKPTANTTLKDIGAKVLDFYDKLQAEVDEAFKIGWIRQCNAWESWNGRRCKGYCEIAAVCVEMDASQQRKAA